ncbi:hypothetical protein DM860_012217 [Cuscuta australis]|uniref:FANCI helical domain-containing protein n=1 Tax=Cuscuta australis TaxID=267555 RepID=A0A328E6Q9_9ASTE|nr:hypothetical protein DM860_012217 [Cuscuta australis]
MPAHSFEFFKKTYGKSRKAALGREHVVSSIVKLGFGLLEGVEEKSSEQIKYDCIAGPVELGLEVLKSLFDLHDGVRNEDHTILALQKATFSSEAGSSKKTEVYHITGAGLFQVLSGLLRRCLCQQDAELLDIINCIKIENGKVFIEELFDCLVSCTSWMLQLFHQLASNPSDSLDLPGFSLTQENEYFFTLFSILRVGLGILEDFEAKHTLESGQVPMCYLIFLGIIEVNLNTTFFEPEKANDVKKVELVKELSRLVCRRRCNSCK